MFTYQVKLLDQLHGTLPDQAIEVLRQLLGNCSQELTHRGIVDLPGMLFQPAPDPNGPAFLDGDGNPILGPRITIDQNTTISIPNTATLTDRYDRVYGTLGAALTYDASTVSMTVVGIVNGANPGSSITVYNSQSAFAGSSGDDCKAEYNFGMKRWELYDVLRKVQTVVTSYAVDGANKKLTKDTRPTVGHFNAAETQGTLVHTGEAC